MVGGGVSAKAALGDAEKSAESARQCAAFDSLYTNECQ